MKIERLDWRHDREEHIARHGVSREEVEEAIFDDRAGMLLRQGPAQRNPDETVYQHLGCTEAGRYLFTALLYTSGGEALPLTARDMTDTERRRYRR
jgi:uncharacterized DUF497 family protein